MTITANFIFSGYSDYWRGMGDRGRGHGAAFAYYGRDTTLKDLVDQWVDESWNNEHDFEDLPESVSQDDIRDAILEMLSDSGRADYESGALWADDFDPLTCSGCGECVGDPHDEDCENATTAVVEDDDCDEDDDYCESPQAIIEIDWSDHPDYYGGFKVGQRVKIDCTDWDTNDTKYVCADIVKLTNTSVFVEIDGKMYRRAFEDVCINYTGKED